MSDAGNTCVAEMVSCAAAGAAAIAPSASTAALSAVFAVFILIYLPVVDPCYLAFRRNQSPGEAPVAIHRREASLGLLERANFHVVESQPREQRRQVHARERLHEGL